MDRRDAKIVRDALMSIIRVLERTYQLDVREGLEQRAYTGSKQPEETPALSRR